MACIRGGVYYKRHQYATRDGYHPRTGQPIKAGECKACGKIRHETTTSIVADQLVLTPVADTISGAALACDDLAG